ncbi:GDP-mannose mannosyl hydrolase [Shewanella sp. WXL01]|uniref:GDP-mannose mannosyl hydrolase n=1 Tax=Shewanella maritima TaxID=2520507 RepID=A0A411PE61_9GAMM|nr:MULTISPECIES: GDP-mannose mannosyl hydrolase [Shewanella]NKF50090.1 GDP-mannose mannosyl hydrolase [Shewanella sp. WXL01]QBF81856.1 GDP-mannose mannosyl hydrolase [Shewanella maritima]
MFLDKDTFETVIESTPLISIDLVVENSNGAVLLGHRNNRPAKGYWFVPGGRIRKNEKLDDAFLRLCVEELGVEATRQQAHCLGPYEHFYDDYVFGTEVSTHYVVIGYKIIVDIDIESLPEKQHNQYRWFTKNEMKSSSDVHLHSKWYIE